MFFHPSVLEQSSSSFSSEHTCVSINGFALASDQLDLVVAVLCLFTSNSELANFLIPVFLSNFPDSLPNRDTKQV